LRVGEPTLISEEYESLSQAYLKLQPKASKADKWTKCADEDEGTTSSSSKSSSEED